MIYDIIDKLGCRDTFDFYLNAGREMKVGNKKRSL